jgi:hypothetical protein
MAKNKKISEIRREPIILDKNTVALIHIFDRYDELEDVCILSDNDIYFSETMEQYNKSAKQFISQLKDEWCVAFMENLIVEGFKTMIEQDRAAFTKDYANILIKKIKRIK